MAFPSTSLTVPLIVPRVSCPNAAKKSCKKQAALIDKRMRGGVSPVFPKVWQDFTTDGPTGRFCASHRELLRDQRLNRFQFPAGFRQLALGHQLAVAVKVAADFDDASVWRGG